MLVLKRTSCPDFTCTAGTCKGTCTGTYNGSLPLVVPEKQSFKGYVSTPTMKKTDI